jgi:hypothetical protein
MLVNMIEAPSMPVPTPDPESAASWAQLAVNIGVFCAAAAAALFSYFRKVNPPSVPKSSDFELAAGMLMDMGPVRDLTAEARRIAAALEGILEVQSAARAPSRVAKAAEEIAEHLKHEAAEDAQRERDARILADARREWEAEHNKSPPGRR